MSNNQLLQDIIRDEESSQPITTKNEETVEDDQVSEKLEDPKNDDIEKVDNKNENCEEEKVVEKVFFEGNKIGIKLETTEMVVGVMLVGDESTLFLQENGTNDSNVDTVPETQLINSVLEILKEPVDGSGMVSMDIPDHMSVECSVLDNDFEKDAREFCHSLIYILICFMLALSVWVIAANLPTILSP